MQAHRLALTTPLRSRFRYGGSMHHALSRSFHFSKALTTYIRLVVSTRLILCPETQRRGRTVGHPLLGASRKDGLWSLIVQSFYDPLTSTLRHHRRKLSLHKTYSLIVRFITFPCIDKGTQLGAQPTFSKYKQLRLCTQGILAPCTFPLFGKTSYLLVGAAIRA